MCISPSISSFMISLSIFVSYSFGLYGQEKDLVRYVNTLQGTNSSWDLSYGNTYPTVGLPVGMHFWSAQTGKNGDGWKYQYSAKAIRGSTGSWG